MIDVVFLLIIFFLVSSHLAQRENRIELDLPVAAQGQDDVQDQSKRITVNVVADGTILVAGREVSPVTLTTMLANTTKDHGNDLHVRIRADRNVSYDKVSPIMKAATDAGIWNVTFAVTEAPSH